MANWSTLVILVALVAIASFFFQKEPEQQVNEANTQPTTNVADEPISVDESTPSTEESPVKADNTLDLRNRNLTQLPAEVLQMATLEELDISNNNLTNALPAEIRELRNLKVLRARNNQMTGIPAEIGQLNNLEIIDFSNNQLTGLPYELGNLQNLKTLNLSGNNYSQQDLEIIKQRLPGNVQIILE